MEYRVKALYLQGKRKQPYEGGDIVTEANFAPGAVDGLIRGGWIEEYNGKAAPVVVTPDPVAPAVIEPAVVAGEQVIDPPVVNPPAETETATQIPKIEDITKKEIIKALQGQSFDPTWSKQKLYDILYPVDPVV